MAVYVDDLKMAYGRMKMCHMMADSLKELHEMADSIGVDRKHYQPQSRPHYDICQSKRKAAIANGALAVGWREMAEISKQINQQVKNGAYK